MNQALDPTLKLKIGNKGYIESLDTRLITPGQIQRIYEIEQDMWAHGLGSYIGCDDCNRISSKQDIYGDLERPLQIRTVAAIEQTLGGGIPRCPDCAGSCHHIFDEAYRDDDITKRYKFDESFLTVYRDISGEIKGFINAYISDFDTIYTKEFEPFYGVGSREIVRDKTRETLGGAMPDKLLALNNMGAQQAHVSMTLLYYLLKHICQDIHLSQPHISGIYDSILGNSVHGMHHIIGGKRLHVTDHLEQNTINRNYPTDIMPHPNAIESTLANLGDSSFSFFKQHKDAIKSIVNA